MTDYKVRIYSNEHCATTLTVDNVFDWNQLLEIKDEVEAD